MYILIYVELMEALKKTENISENVLSQDTETKQWFNPSPLENQTISFEVPIIHFTAQDTYAKLNKQVSGTNRYKSFFWIFFFYDYSSTRKHI